MNRHLGFGAEAALLKIGGVAFKLISKRFEDWAKEVMTEEKKARVGVPLGPSGMDGGILVVVGIFYLDGSNGLAGRLRAITS